MKLLRTVISLAAATCLPVGVRAEASASAATPTARRILYGKPRIVSTLANEKIDESSGLAASRATPGVFWTHNDSGDAPRLFAFDMKGRDLGTYSVRGARNRDWEDLASFSLGGKHYLLICDTGDNDRRRPFVTLYVAAEPMVDPAKRGVRGTIAVVQAIHFTYDDGPQDCEAVAVDATTRTIYLVSKRVKRTVYALPIPAKTVSSKLTAKSVAELPIGQVVAMDISPDGLRAVVLTYGNALEFTRSPKGTWRAAFARPGRKLAMPGRRQGESICYGPDGRTLHLTSEKLPTPLLEVPALSPKAGR